METDYYSYLGVSHTATEEEIKAAYRQLVKKYHPDKNDSEFSTVIFERIQKAYETLSDPYVKQVYDESFQGQDVKENSRTQTKTSQGKPERTPKINFSKIINGFRRVISVLSYLLSHFIWFFFSTLLFLLRLIGYGLCAFAVTYGSMFIMEVIDWQLRGEPTNYPFLESSPAAKGIIISNWLNIGIAVIAIISGGFAVGYAFYKSYIQRLPVEVENWKG